MLEGHESNLSGKKYSVTTQSNINKFDSLKKPNHHSHRFDTKNKHNIDREQQYSNCHKMFHLDIL